ncbi:hypothetical protein ACFP2T_12395 [Plantactinospora solaniradicis]|uniref:Uncharacterized protein n=1 Tax=Plantactinospora solaniradicis TaxID=1723736 RepID=A0ABW1K6V8_9ACTN
MTRVVRRDVSASVSADQPDVWTVLDSEAADDVADALAQSLSRCLRADGGWYADFTLGNDHVVVFANRVFRYRRGDLARRAEVVAYGRTVGVPEHQLDWTD